MRHQLPYHDITADETVAIIKAAGGKLHRISTSQIDNADNFIQLFDAAVAADVILGTTVPVYTIFVPAGDATLRGAVTEDYGDAGMDFQYGIAAAVATTAGGNTGPTTALPLNAAFS